jgi:streptomycin 6-kinase
MTAALDAVPPACRRRLVEHYGSAVECWLATVPVLLGEAAARWRLRLVGYHDAGCASAIALARSIDQRTVLLKAWYDRGRYAYEVAALRAWPPGRVPRVLHAADDLTVAALELVGGRPGGSVRPSGEYEAVALGIADLHQTSGGAFPRLDDHIANVVLPRIDRRLRTFGGDVSERYLEAVAHLEPDPSRTALLHADLYRENVPFDRDGRPVFVDPLPMLGDPVYDWAFWVVYYDLLRDPVSRLRLASAIGEIPLVDLVPWCLTLCVDGLLYYREVGDPRAPRMLDVMAALAVYERAVVVC